MTIINRKKELEELLNAVRAIKENEYFYRDSVLNILQMIKHQPQAEEADRENIVSGLGRIILDDYDFAESELGGRILNFARQYRQHGL